MKLLIDENHFKAMIGKYVPVERIENFKKDLISETFSDDKINLMIDSLYYVKPTLILDSNLIRLNKTIEKLKRVSK